MEIILEDELFKKLENGDAFIEFPVEIMVLDGKPTEVNHMIYPLEEMKKAVNTERIQKTIDAGKLFSELGNPSYTNDLRRWTTIDQTNVHSRFTKLWFEGNKLMGMVRTVPDNGNLMMKSILSGLYPSFAIRVLGEVNKTDNGVKILKNISLVTIDWKKPID